MLLIKIFTPFSTKNVPDKMRRVIPDMGERPTNNQVQFWNFLIDGLTAG